MLKKKKYIAVIVCVILFVCMLVIGGNKLTASTKPVNAVDTVNVVNLRDMFTIKNGVLDDHEYYLFFDKITGEYKGQEHKPECKTCYDIFD